MIHAEGNGATHKEALEHAIRSAVQQGVKTLVAAETLTAKDKVIRDEILTATAGMVEGYKPVRATEKGGVWRVVIVARVAEKKLTTSLEAAKVPVRAAAVDGPGLFAKAVSEDEAGKNTARWLTRLLDGYPWGCLQVEVTEYKELAAKRTDATMTIGFTVKQSIDAKAYAKVAAHLSEALEVLAVRPAEPFVNGAYRHNGYAPGPFWHYPAKYPAIDETRYTCARVVGSVTGTGRSEDYFKFSGRTFILYKPAAKSFFTAERPVALRITLRDKDGGMVKETDFSQRSAGLLWASSNGFPMIWPALSSGDYVPSETQGGYEIQLSRDQVPRVAKVAISVEPVAK